VLPLEPVVLLTVGLVVPVGMLLVALMTGLSDENNGSIFVEPSFRPRHSR